MTQMVFKIPSRLACAALSIVLASASSFIARGEAPVSNSRFVTATIAPSAGNPRNSEGDFVQLHDGRILFIYTHHYGGNGQDDAPAYLASRVSRDGGATWSKSSERVIANE